MFCRRCHSLHVTVRAPLAALTCHDLPDCHHTCRKTHAGNQARVDGIARVAARLHAAGQRERTVRCHLMSRQALLPLPLGIHQ